MAFVAALLAFPLLLGAQDPVPAPAVAIGVRVTHVEIDLTLDPAKGSLRETVALTIEGRGVTRLAFALDEGLAVASSRGDAGVVDYRQAGDAVYVDLDPPLEGTRTLTFAIAGRPGHGSESRIETALVVLSPSMPWYPALPGFWGTASVVVRLPAGWGALAPGIPEASSLDGFSRWTTRRPVRSIAVAAAPGLRASEGTLVTTPVHVAGPSVKAVSARLAPAMAWFSAALAPYPFDAFNLAVVPGFEGRVDASGFVIVGRDAPLTTDSDGADLLAGQWWGQALGGDGGWIESFAAWEACVFARDRALPLPSNILAARRAYFELRSGDVAIAEAKATAPAAVLRGKGSAAPDMIRLAAGDRATFDAVRELFSGPVGPSIGLIAVRTAVEKQAGRPLEREFADWFGHAGVPELSASLRSIPAAGGGFRADVALRQKRAAYRLPVEIVLYGPSGGEHRETVEVADELTSVFYVVPFEPTRIEIDPLDRIFRWK